jgi:hypothetical protein
VLCGPRIYGGAASAGRQAGRWEELEVRPGDSTARNQDPTGYLVFKSSKNIVACGSEGVGLVVVENSRMEFMRCR